MDLGFYQRASYVPQGSSALQTQRRQQQWEQYRAKQQAASSAQHTDGRGHESRGEAPHRSSAHFNAPTAVEVERAKGHRKRAMGMDKLKGVVKGLVRL